MGALELIYFGVIRFILPVISLLILFISAKTVLHGLKRKTLAKFAVESYADVVEVKSSESIIGSGIMCDVRIKRGGINRQHALLSLTDYGFKITPMAEDCKIYVNDYLVEDEAYLQSGDKLKIGNTVLQIAINPAINPKAKAKSDKAAKSGRLCSALLLTVFQLLCGVAFILHNPKEFQAVAIAFGGTMILEWIYMLIRGFKSNVGVEISAFFLSTIGLCIAASATPEMLIKKFVFLGAGFILYVLLLLILNNIELVEKLVIPVGVLAVLLLLTNLAIGTSLNGARNWIIIGGVSFQPSEFVKVAFVFVSACSLDRMIKTKNIMSFLAFTGVCLISLAIMRDFGTAAVYFATLLVILSLRLCDVKFIVALGGGAALCFGALIKVIPYISARFATYRHAWEYANSSGYQQTRTMMSIASGGLFGLGAGNGTLSSVSAADTDLVFGMVAEEFGLIVALVVALIPIIYLIYAAVCIPRTRSIYYGVTAAAAAAMFIIQTALNIFGSVDLLPLTGVTVPFVSNGGSSMLASFMLLAFIKTAGSKIITLEKKEGASK